MIVFLLKENSLMAELLVQTSNTSARESSHNQQTTRECIRESKQPRAVILKRAH